MELSVLARKGRSTGGPTGYMQGIHTYQQLRARGPTDVTFSEDFTSAN